MAASAAAAFLILRGAPLVRARVAPARWLVAGLCTSSKPQPREAAAGDAATGPPTLHPPSSPPPLRPPTLWADKPDYRRWKDKETEILNDIEPIKFLTKDILHSDRYVDGERLSAEDEKEVVQKLLAYHPHSEDKIGCGIDSIMVDRHPQFKNSRCLFVVRTDGGWIDFSYQKCLRAYIRDKYPDYAERFIREHFKRGN